MGIFYLLNTSISFIFPIYASYKSLETNEIDKIKPWLIYWVVFGNFVLVEGFFQSIINLVPFYNFFKFGFLSWLILPLTNEGKESGCGFLYFNYLKPWLDTEFSVFVNNVYKRAHSFIRQSNIGNIFASKFVDEGSVADSHEGIGSYWTNQLNNGFNQLKSTGIAATGLEKSISDLTARLNDVKTSTIGNTTPNSDYQSTNLIYSFLSMVLPVATPSVEVKSDSNSLNEPEFDFVDKIEVDEKEELIPKVKETTATGWFWSSKTRE